jgi:hypothetical protein
MFQDVCRKSSSTLFLTSTRLQIALAMSIIAMALVVSCALIASAQLQTEESVLFGLGSGEEQEGANAIATTFKTFDAEDDYVKETLGEDYYVDKFKAVLDDDAYGKNVKEVEPQSFTPPFHQSR